MRAKLGFLLSTLLTTYSGAYAWAQATPYDFNADSITYRIENNEVLAEGNVRIVSEQGSAWADRMSFNTLTGQTIVEGNVTLIDQNRTTVFVERAVLEKDLNHIVIQTMLGRLGPNGPAFSAREGRRNGPSEYQLIDSAFSPCPICSDEKSTPLWQIRAGKITYDTEEQTLAYKNAFFDFYGVPIFYMPYLKHSTDNTPRSGMLPPRFDSSSDLGQSVTLSYYYRHSDQSDYIVRSRLMSDRGAMFLGQGRFLYKNLEGDFNGSFINDTHKRDDRAHIRGNAEYRLTDSRRIGINGSAISDNTYLDEYFNETPSYLPTTLYAEDTQEDRYFGIYLRHYHDLRAGYQSDRTAQIMPRLIYEKNFLTDSRGGMLHFNADAMRLERDVGLTYDRLITNLSYSKPFTFATGDMLEFGVNLRGDYYNVDDTMNIADEGDFYRGNIQGVINWQRPYISPTGQHRFTPRAALITSPTGVNKRQIPNQDSVGYELDISNLFQADRFAGYDVIESGSRFVYGFDNEWGTPSRTYLRFFFGQSYRIEADDTVPIGSGTHTDGSDWVTLLEANPVTWFNIRSASRLDNSSFSFKRTDNSLRLGTRQRYIRVGHTMLDNGPHEINADAGFSLTPRWNLDWSIRRDLNNGGNTLTNRAQLTYLHECYEASFSVRRRGYRNRDLHPSTEFMLNLQLRSISFDNGIKTNSFF